MNTKLNINELKSNLIKSITLLLFILLGLIAYVMVYKQDGVFEHSINMFLTSIVLFTIFLAYIILVIFLNKFSIKINDFHNETIEKIKFNEGYLKAVENSSSNIIVTSLNRKLFSANKAFFNFSGFKDVADFRKKYECVCDLFIQKDGFLKKHMNDLKWMEYISKYPNLSHKAIMLKNGKEHIFQVTSSSLNVDEKNRRLATFVDITELENLKDRYQFAINGTQDGLWDWNLINNDIYFSAQWKKQIGYEDDELQNELKTWETKTHPDDLKKAKEDFRANIEGETDFYENIHRLKHKNGSWVWILDRGKTIFDENKNAIRMVGFHTDITKHKELEQQISEQTKMLKEAQHLAHIGSWELYINKNEIAYSDEIANIFEFKQHEMISEYSNFIKNIHPDDLNKFEETYHDSIKNKTRYSIVYRIITQKTNKIKYVENRGENIFKKGNLIKSIGTIQDITQQYESQVELHKLKKVIEQSPISIVITDTKGQLEYVNPGFCKVTGYSYEEAIGQNSNILQTGYTTKQEYEKLWQNISQDKIWKGTFKNKRKNGEKYWETATIIPIDNGDGKIINYLGIKQEITKEVHLKQEIKDQEEIMIAQSRHAAMGEMISMIAHQWRQPLSIISMASNNILVDIEFDSIELNSLKETSLEIIEQTQELSKTIDDFRDFFKPNKNIEVILIQDVIQEALQIMGKALENNEIQVIKHYQNKQKIQTYSRELMHVLINILKNAKEALVEKKVSEKSIQIEVYDNTKDISIKISDNAGGIDKNTIQNIFQPYFTTKHEKNGTGLGLYMSKTIVEKHLQGIITVSNTPNGVCFEIILPYVLDNQKFKNIEEKRTIELAQI